MAARTLYFQAPFGATTYLDPAVQAGRALLTVADDEACAMALGSFWYVVDVDVRGVVQSVPIGGTCPPQASFSRFPAQSPLHLELEWGWSGVSIAGVIASSGGGTRSRVLLDAVPGRYYVCGTGLNLSVIGPTELGTYDAGRSDLLATRYVGGTIFTQVQALIFPVRWPGPAGAELGKVSFRLSIPAGSVAETVVIPPGARTLQIFETTASGGPWEWGFGSGGAIGRVLVPAGQSEIVAVPNASTIGPATAIGAQRDMLLVFGVCP